MKRSVNLIFLDNEEDYKSEFVSSYVDKKYNLHEIPVVFTLEDFDHIFSEPEAKTGVRMFSIRRAKRMMFIQAILEGISKTELMFEIDSGNIAIFSTELECVLYLRIRPATKTLQIGTFFDFGRDHTKMYKKQKSKCRDISIEELKEAVVSGLTTSRNADS